MAPQRPDRDSLSALRTKLSARLFLVQRVSVGEVEAATASLEFRAMIEIVGTTAAELREYLLTRYETDYGMTDEQLQSIGWWAQEYLAFSGIGWSWQSVAANNIVLRNDPERFR